MLKSQKTTRMCRSQEKVYLCLEVTVSKHICGVKPAALLLATLVGMRQVRRLACSNYMGVQVSVSLC